MIANRGFHVGKPLKEGCSASLLAGGLPCHSLLNGHNVLVHHAAHVVIIAEDEGAINVKAAGNDVLAVLPCQLASLWNGEVPAALARIEDADNLSRAGLQTGGAAKGRACSPQHERLASAPVMSTLQGSCHQPVHALRMQLPAVQIVRQSAAPGAGRSLM